MKWLLLESQTQRELADWLAVMSYPAQHSNAEIRIFSLYFVRNFHFILAIKRHQQSLSPCECGGGSVLLKWLMKAKWPLFLCLAMNLGLTVFTHKGTVVYCSIKSPCSNFLDGQQRNWHFLACTYLKPF